MFSKIDYSSSYLLLPLCKKSVVLIIYLSTLSAIYHLCLVISLLCSLYITYQLDSDYILHIYHSNIFEVFYKKLLRYE